MLGRGRPANWLQLYLTGFLRRRDCYLEDLIFHNQLWEHGLLPTRAPLAPRQLSSLPGWRQASSVGDKESLRQQTLTSSINPVCAQMSLRPCGATLPKAVASKQEHPSWGHLTAVLGLPEASHSPVDGADVS